MNSSPHADSANADQPARKGGLLGVGVGAGVLGAAVLALRCLIRPPTKARIPEFISPLSFRTREYQSSRGQMIYHEGGAAGPLPTLVFVHDPGVGASSYEWSKVYAAFADERRVLALDLIGFGESERRRAKLTAEDYAASLAEFIGELCEHEAQLPIVIASGLGAGIVSLMAEEHPELIARLALWMPVGKASTSLALNLGSRLPIVNRFLYRNTLARRSMIRRIFRRRGADAPDAVPSEAIEVYALCAKQFQAEYAVYRWLQRRLDVDLDACLAGLSLPVALLWAGKSGARAMEDAARFAASNRRCASRVVPGVTRNAPLENPAAVAEALREELQSELRVLKAAG